MYSILSLLAGAFAAIMIISNGKLNASYGLFLSTLIIHILGLSTMVVILIFKKTNPFSKKFPLSFMLGGFIGIATTLINSYVFGKLDLGSIVALGLLGQSVTSLIIDQLGAFSRPKNTVKLTQLFGLLLIFIGIISMLKEFHFLPVLLSVLTGTTLVISRILNAKLSEFTSTFISTFYNYFTGCIGSLLLVFVFWNEKNLLSFTNFHFQPFLYLGAFLSVIVVFLASFLLNKISAFYVTLMMFLGQLFTGMLWDFFVKGVFSMQSFLGGIFVSLGFILYLSSTSIENTLRKKFKKPFRLYKSSSSSDVSSKS